MVAAFDVLPNFEVTLNDTSPVRMYNPTTHMINYMYYKENTKNKIGSCFLVVNYKHVMHDTAQLHHVMYDTAQLPELNILHISLNMTHFYHHKRFF